MKTDIKQLLKEISTRDLEFREPSDAKLLNKKKEYHFHDTYMIGNQKFEYTYPCLVEIEFENSKIFSLNRKGEIQQNVIKVDKDEYLGIKKPITIVTPITEIVNTTQVDTTVVSDAAAKALIGEFFEKNQ